MKTIKLATLLAASLSLGLVACDKGGGGGYDAYINDMCACKDGPCMATAATKHAETIKKMSTEQMSADQAKKLADCQKAAMGVK